MSAAITKEIAKSEVPQLYKALLAIYYSEDYNGSGYVALEMDKNMNRLADFGFVKCKGVHLESSSIFLYSLTEKGKRAIEDENATKVTED